MYLSRDEKNALPFDEKRPVCDEGKRLKVSNVAFPIPLDDEKTTR